MLDRLRQLYAPSSKEDAYNNFLALFFLEQGSQESVDYFISQIRRYAASLRSAGIHIDPCVLLMIFMKGLSNTYELLKQDFALNPSKYACLSVEELQQFTVKFNSTAKHVLPLSPSAKSVAAAAGVSAPGAPKQSGSSGTSTLDVDDIKKVAASGACMCGRQHKLELCNFFLWAGYLIDYNEAKAAEKWEVIRKRKKKGNSRGSSTASSASSNPLSAAESPPPNTVGGASHTSANPYAALESDDDDDDDDDDGFQDVGVGLASAVVDKPYASAVVGKPNNRVAPYMPPPSNTTPPPIRYLSGYCFITLACITCGSLSGYNSDSTYCRLWCNRSYVA